MLAPASPPSRSAAKERDRGEAYESAKVDEARVRVLALSRGGDAGRGLLRGWKDVWPGAWAESLREGRPSILLLALGPSATLGNVTPVRPPAEVEVGIAEKEREVDMVGIVVDERMWGKRVEDGL